MNKYDIGAMVVKQDQGVNTKYLNFTESMFAKVPAAIVRCAGKHVGISNIEPQYSRQSVHSIS